MNKPIYGLTGLASLAPVTYYLHQLIKSEHRLKYGFIESHTLRVDSPTSLNPKGKTGDWPVILEPCALAALIESGKNESTLEAGIACVVSFQSFTDGSRRAIVRLATREFIA